MSLILGLLAGGALLGAGAKTVVDNVQAQNEQSASAENRLAPMEPKLVKMTFAECVASTFQPAVEALEQFKTEKLDPLIEDIRIQQAEQISLNERVLSEEQQQADQQFKLASILLCTTTTSLILYPPLILLHLPLYFISGLPIYKKAYLDFVQRQQVTTVTLDTAIELGTIFYAPFNPAIIVLGMIAQWSHSLSNKIITQVKDGTRQKLTNLMGETPQYVWVLHDGVEIKVPFETVKIDDLVVIAAGEVIPVDGVVERGMATIDQQLLTGEAQPVEKGVGDTVFAATVVMAGSLVLRVTKTGEETAVAHIGQMLVDTASFTSSVELRGQEISDKAAFPTLVGSALAFPLVGPSGGLAVLIAGIGHNMHLLGPLSVLNYLQLIAHQGILIKDGRALEQIQQVDTVVFDKTGTLTLDTLRVGALHVCDGYDETTVLTCAATAEFHQTHPIANAILQAATDRNLTVASIDESAYEIGYGVKVTLDEQLIRVGSKRFMDIEAIAVPDSLTATVQKAHKQGYSPVYVAVDDQLVGVIELQPTIRPEAKHIVESLKQRGLSLIIISGDHEAPTAALAQQLGVEQYFAETLPQNKAALITQLQEAGRVVCFVGDGINDSIALKTAHVSVSLRGASTVATDTAQIILMDQTLKNLETLFETAQAFEKNMSINYRTTVVPGVIIIGGAFTGLLGFATAIPIVVAGLAVGVYNAMLPRFEIGAPSNKDND
ncbi:MAG: heavy metal translocating P-type ATPase [Chloroflexota bacterium]